MFSVLFNLKLKITSKDKNKEIFFRAFVPSDILMYCYHLWVVIFFNFLSSK